MRTAAKSAASSKVPKPASKPAAPSPAQSRVTAMLEDIRQRGDEITSEINALLVRLK